MSSNPPSYRSGRSGQSSNQQHLYQTPQDQGVSRRLPPPPGQVIRGPHPYGGIEPHPVNSVISARNDFCLVFGSESRQFGTPGPPGMRITSVDVAMKEMDDGSLIHDEPVYHFACTISVDRYIPDSRFSVSTRLSHMHLSPRLGGPPDDSDVFAPAAVVFLWKPQPLNVFNIASRQTFTTTYSQGTPLWVISQSRRVNERQGRIRATDYTVSFALKSTYQVPAAGALPHSMVNLQVGNTTGFVHPEDGRPRGM